MTNNKPYSNTKATLAIAKASLRSILRSPSAVVFSLVFPLIFIVVFANIGGSGVTVDVAVAKTCDTSQSDSVYQALKRNKIINLITDQSTEEMNKNLWSNTFAKSEASRQFLDSEERVLRRVLIDIGIAK